ncbi:MAG: cobalamin-binding protein [Methylibium sp.]|nr:cobalamin-binding protein [Methylibium sp.]
MSTAELTPPTAVWPGIAAVERETGISKDSLRIWERRYAFPQPARDAGGERVYPPEQVLKLRLIKRLLDRGYRAGRLVPASLDSLQALLAEAQPALGAMAATPARDDFAPFIEALRSHQFEELRRLLVQTLVRMGLGPGIEQLIAPLTGEVGELWMRGELQIFEEHVFSESVQAALRQAMQAVPRPAQEQKPRVLLSTLPGEQHGLGLTMAEAMFVLEGSQCLSLGVQTPVRDLVLAAAAHRADVVALSCSAFVGPSAVAAGLAELRQALPAEIEIWAGGSSPALQRRSAHPSLRHVVRLGQIAEELARWRASHPG